MLKLLVLVFFCHGRVTNHIHKIDFVHLGLGAVCEIIDIYIMLSVTEFSFTVYIYTVYTVPTSLFSYHDNSGNCLFRKKTSRFLHC